MKATFKVLKAHRLPTTWKKRSVPITKIYNFINSIIMGQKTKQCATSFHTVPKTFFQQDIFSLNQGLETFSVNDQRVNTSGCAKYMASDIIAQKYPETLCKLIMFLCSNKTSFTKSGQQERSGRSKRFISNVYKLRRKVTSMTGWAFYSSALDCLKQHTK